MKRLFCLMFALLLSTGSWACNKGGEESDEESATESPGEESTEEGEAAVQEGEEEEEEAPEIDPALVGHWAQGSGDIVTFNSRGRAHMGSSGCVGTYTAIDGNIRTTFDNAGPNCQNSRMSYTIDGETLTWITNWTRRDAEDDLSI